MEVIENKVLKKVYNSVNISWAGNIYHKFNINWSIWYSPLSEFFLYLYIQ